MMKKMLFVIPSMSMGGTTMSLLSLLNSCIAKNNEIDVFAITKGDLASPFLLKYIIGYNGQSTAYYGCFGNLSFFEKIKYFPIKVLKRLPIGNKWLENRVVRQTIRRIEKQKQYDAVVGFQEGLATRFTSHFSCNNKVAWIHCDYAYAYDESIQEIEIYNKYTSVVCVSDFTRQGFVKRYPSLEDKTIAIRNIFDVESILQKSKEAIDDARFDNSQFTILSVGRVCDVKRFDLIPEMANQLRKQGLKFRWYVIGNAIPSELAKLTDAIKRYNVDKEVVYLGGKPNPYPYFKRSNLLVSLSKSEACPMIFNEAKILQLPIISADFGSAFEFIMPGEDGFITTIEQMPQRILEIAEGKISTSQKKDKEYFFTWNKKILAQLTQLFS